MEKVFCGDIFGYIKYLAVLDKLIEPVGYDLIPLERSAHRARFAVRAGETYAVVPKE